ncbi:MULTISPECIES: hypothetical protein [Pseudomonadota]|jgi:hypothetical protein|uniref:Uncharacterized protein n=4 Tax=Stutzerimonas stutzeri group TaxID=136846 RepID=A0ABD4Y415_STUST|nr:MULTISPECIES: hypothetical protein [Pseudomonadota]MAF87502.1 hypothetical protein [Pseudomonas sp.]MBU0564778.1 hypothetical protein [Gammaproteobacteria bacterium]MCB4795424.1 hypothetical protein [Pseudomonas sp. NP21570]MDT3711058.1 hypothetical protein [Pseudomonadaceae bacterium]OCX21593.1 hypothetical protein BBI09_04260 [Stutzerimonas xanthomarina]RRV18556.1 hypothetical protein EGJ29_19060 [Pseudomonas sp. s199]|tara:strand:+ start:1628 stop:2062 length:435 start_codon:yes stop_codon:yes gene_type:complete
MSILILNCERDEVGGQYLVASIHGVEHCVSLDDDYPEKIPDSDDIVHRINADDFNELSEKVRSYVRKHSIAPIHSLDDVRLLAMQLGDMKAKTYEIDEEGHGLTLRDCSVDKGVRILARKFQSTYQAHRWLTEQLDILSFNAPR